MIKNTISIVLKEIDKVLMSIDEDYVDLSVNEILSARTIVVLGAGRMGLVAKAFAMRLGHLGLKAYTIGDSTLPHISKKDLMIICSGSGETQTIYDFAVIGKQQQARILLVSSYIDHTKSRMAKIADTVMVINAPSKVMSVAGIASIQPMTTLYEQCVFVFFDALVILLMERLKVKAEDMRKRHSVLE